MLRQPVAVDSVEALMTSPEARARGYSRLSGNYVGTFGPLSEQGLSHHLIARLQASGDYLAHQAASGKTHEAGNSDNCRLPYLARGYRHRGRIRGSWQMRLAAPAAAQLVEGRGRKGERQKTAVLRSGILTTGSALIASNSCVR